MDILVEGDSWAYTFTFPNSISSEQNPGFGHWLTQGRHRVQVRAVQGSTNTASIERIEQYADPVDAIVWIQTEPIRDFFFSEPCVDERGVSRVVLDCDRVYDLADWYGGLTRGIRHHLQTVTYPRLNRAAQAKQVPVLMLGGCSPVQTDLIQDLDHLEALIPNIPGMFLPNCAYQSCLFQNTHNWVSDYHDFIMRSKNRRLIRDWQEETKNINEKLLSWNKDQKYFNPDKWHVNRSAHRKIAEIILARLNVVGG